MTKQLLNCPAPAKLNLFLHVTGRRADSYHLLQSVFQLIDIQDTLSFTLRSDEQIKRITPIPDVAEDADLTVRAARLLQAEVYRKSGKKPGVDIAITKRLPAGGGLGGGSSDAATTLMALNNLWQAGLSKNELMRLGLSLGADIPFFIFGRNAFAEGVGEILMPVETPESTFVVIDPGISIPTATIFASKELTRDSKKVKIIDFLSHSDKNCFFGRNDLQAIAEKCFPEMAKALKWLSRYAYARMTGSGACVFAQMADETADAVLQQLPQAWKGWKTKGLKKHPLDAILAASGKS